MAIRKFGKAKRKCKLCNSSERLIRRYNINICGRCFREVARDIGFKKYN